MIETRQQDSATQTLRRLDRIIREVVAPAVVVGRVPLAVEAATVGGEPIPFDVATRRDLQPLSVGDTWGRAWDTMWLRVSGRVPDNWTRAASTDGGLELALDVDLGFSPAQAGFQAEGLVFDAHGAVVRALSPRNHWVPLSAGAGEDVLFWVEAAANPTLSTPDGTGLIPLSRLGSWDSAGDDHLYRFGGAALILRDTQVQALLADVGTLRGIAAEPDTGVRRRHLILAAFERMLRVLDPTAVRDTVAAARAELAPTLAAPAHASAMTLTAVGHAHIDSAWLWPLRETVRKCARTFSNVVALMDADPDLVFACSSAQQFAWMKDHYPELFARMSEKVHQGRFVPVGGMWVETDTTMPSGEAMARQFVAGQRFFREEFGLTCEEVWLPDSFGYSGALPQIARLAGARWFFGQKMSWNRTNRMPHHTFDWEGIDGSRILTHFTPVETYNSDLSPTELAFAERNFEDHRVFSGGLIPFGYGDGGGGPTAEMLEAGRRAADVEGLPRVRFGSPAEFFAAAEAESTDRAVWVGEMYLELHRGTYSSQARTKRGNRRCETLLREAELWAATAAVRRGHPYPQRELEELWRRTLLLQFHDILPGSSISWVHQDAERMHAQNESRLRAVIGDALSALAGDGGERLTVNSSPFSRHGIPGHSIGRAVETPDPTRVGVDGDAVTLSNRHIELHISPDGSFTRLLSRASGHDYLEPTIPANQLHLHQDIPTDWDAWDIDEHYRRLRLDLPQQCEVTVGEDSVTIVRRLAKSVITQEVRLSGAGVDVETHIDWHEQQRLLKLAFPLRVDARESCAETQFGHVRRPVHENTSWDEARFEIVAQRWIHVGDGARGAAVLNDSTYGHDVTRLPDPAGGGAQYLTQIRQTLLRGPRYPDPESDQGEHPFRTRLLVDADVAATVEAAYDLSMPVLEIDDAGTVEPLVVCEGDGVVVDTVKLAEDGSGDLIVRLYESTGRPARARVAIEADDVWPVNLLEDPVDDRLDVDGRSVGVDLRGFEILTLRARLGRA
ncbi:MAG TPA: glycoside hydrolase family 38 C-terminal domain-containing protein [Arachnia sp.]|nr:glycoside hydrolase family 38 C-terminal domain-containing protein [Arachnia sp.]